MGSTAGAGSGEFHMYRAARRRELDRMARIDSEAATTDAREKFESSLAGKRAALEEQTQKRAQKRRKRKEAAKRTKGGTKDKDTAAAAHNDDDDDDDAVNDDEFEYEPVTLAVKQAVIEVAGQKVPVPTDGSFLATMQKLSAAGVPAS